MDPSSKSAEDSTASCSKTRCYYVCGSIVPFDEDVTHEFKGHKNLSEEEIPPWTQIANTDRRTRGPVSKCLNGFLNNECGGTVYLGILDDGTVNGFSLTQFQKDHVRVSLDDLMERYHPPVEEHRYTVKFVPIVDKDCSEEDIERIVSYNSSKSVSCERRQTPHTLRDYKRCWCDQDRIAQFQSGILAARYVIEIIIKPWYCNDPRNKHAVGKMKAIPIHEDETGCVNFRKHATVVSHYNMQQLCDISKDMVRNHYEPKIERLTENLQLHLFEAYKNTHPLAETLDSKLSPTQTHTVEWLSTSLYAPIPMRLRQEIRQLRMSHYHQDRGGDTAPSSDPSDQTMSED